MKYTTYNLRRHTHKKQSFLSQLYFYISNFVYFFYTAAKFLKNRHQIYSVPIVNLLIFFLNAEKYFKMKKSDCKEALEIYKRFLTRVTKIGEFMKLAEVFANTPWTGLFATHRP